MGLAQAVNVGLMAVALLLLVAWNRPRAQAPDKRRATAGVAPDWPVRLGAAGSGETELRLLLEHLRTGRALRSELNGVTVGIGVRRSASVIVYGYVENRFRIAAWIRQLADLARRLAVEENLLARLDRACAEFSTLPATRLATAFDECLAAGATIAEHESKGARQPRSAPSGPTSTPAWRKRSRTRNWNVDHAPRRASNSR